MRYRFLTADVFTDRPFGGNPLAVLPYAEGLSGAQMQDIAREFNLSETAFVLPARDDSETRHVRIFTPAVELPFAGHPTIGTAFVLATIGEVELAGDETTIVLGEGVGAVPVRIELANGRPQTCELTAAQLPEIGLEPPPVAELATVLRLDPDRLSDDGTDGPQAISCGVPFLYVPLRDHDAVRDAALDRAAWERVLEGTWAPLVYLFHADDGPDGGRVHARMFGPGVGVDEDPATGSAATSLAAYLAARSGATDATLRWQVDQGIEMGRPSRMHAAADLRDGKVAATRVGGTSVIVTEGEIDVP